MRIALVVDASVAAEGWERLEIRYTYMLHVMGVFGSVYKINNHDEVDAPPSKPDDLCKRIRSGADDDGVVLLMPHARCAEYVRALLRIKKHVFAAAWPLSFATDETEDLARLAQKNGVVLDCGRVFKDENTRIDETESGLLYSGMADGCQTREFYDSLCGPDYHGHDMNRRQRIDDALVGVIMDDRSSAMALEIYRNEGFQSCMQPVTAEPAEENVERWCTSDYDCDIGGDEPHSGNRDGASLLRDIYTANLFFGSAPNMVLERSGGPGCVIYDAEGGYLRILLGYEGGRTAILSRDSVSGGDGLNLRAVIGGSTVSVDLAEGVTAGYDNDDDGDDEYEHQNDYPRNDTSLLLLALQNFCDTIEKKEGRRMTNIENVLATAKTARAAHLSDERGIPIYLDLRLQ